MTPNRWLCAGLAGLCLVAPGCTTLREVPRADYTERSERRNVRVVTIEGHEYELDEARIEADTLKGYWRRDVQGPIDEYGTIELPLERVAKLSARRVDWFRTGLVGGLALGAVVAAGLSGRGNGGTVTPPEPCTREPCP